MDYVISLCNSQGTITTKHAVVDDLCNITDPAIAAAVTLLTAAMPATYKRGATIAKIDGVGLIYMYDSLDRMDYDIEESFVTNYRLTSK